MPRPPLLRSLPPLRLPSGEEMVRYAVLGLLVLAVNVKDSAVSAFVGLWVG